jgi:hypothetical protein
MIILPLPEEARKESFKEREKNAFDPIERTDRAAAARYK